MMGYARNGCHYVLSILLIDSDLMRQRVVIFIMVMSLKNALSHITRLPVNVKKKTWKFVFPQLTSKFCVMLHCYNRLFRETRKKLGHSVPAWPVPVVAGRFQVTQSRPTNSNLVLFQR